MINDREVMWFRTGPRHHKVFFFVPKQPTSADIAYGAWEIGPTITIGVDCPSDYWPTACLQTPKNDVRPA